MVDIDYSTHAVTYNGKKIADLYDPRSSHKISGTSLVICLGHESAVVVDETNGNVIDTFYF